MYRFQETGNRNCLVRTVIFAGLAACTFLNVNCTAFPCADHEQKFIGGCPAAKRHLGIDQLVHRAGDSAVTTPHTLVRIHIDPE
jgi:hypothetical protein